MTSDDAALRLVALKQWRSGLLKSGVKESSLPLIEDLSAIAGAPRMDRALMDALPLKHRSSAIKFAPELMSAMRAAANASVSASAGSAGSFTARTEQPAARDGHRDPKATQVQARIGAPNKSASQSPRKAPDRAPTVSPAPLLTGSRPRPGVPEDGGDLGTVVVPATPEQFFAPYNEFAGPANALYEPAITAQDNGSLQVAWVETDDGSEVHIFRVVTSEDWAPYSPESGEVIAVTSGTEVHDVRPLLGALRFIQVWVNVGVDDAAARRSQPSLLAAGIAIAQPRDVVMREDHGTVVGTWQVPPGVSRVDIYRLPAAAAAAGELTGYAPYLLNGDRDDATSGYHDSTCQPGVDYEYRLYAVANHAETEYRSDPVVRQVSVSANLSPVDNLVITGRSNENKAVVDLEWNDPGQGDIWLYRTAKAPTLGSGDDDIPVSALPQAGLQDVDRLRFSARVDGERRSVHGVPWPHDWGRFHLTPVTVDGDVARIGATRTLTRTGDIQDAHLVQRVTWQLLTFSWPDFASEVQVFTTPTGAPVPIAGQSEPLARLDRVTYEAHGGWRLKLRDQWQGCDVHLIPVSFYERASEHGRPMTLHYPGLVRVSYDIIRTAEATRWQGLRRIHDKPSIALDFQCDQLQPPNWLLLDFVLVHRPDRLPLWPDDGQVIQQWQRQPVPPKGAFHALPLSRQPTPHTKGYLRLFLLPDPENVLDIALLDPDFKSLRL
jgi:hypothetical protein